MFPKLIASMLNIFHSTFSICTLVLYDVYPEEFLFLAFYFVLSKRGSSVFLVIFTNIILTGFHFTAVYGISFLAT